MKTNVNFWWVLAAFFGLVAVLYTGWNIAAHPHVPWHHAIEWVGTVSLIFTVFMAGMLAFYVDRVHRSQGGELPEDILTADIDDGDPEIGEFSPWSWWPLVLAFSAAIAILSLSVSIFLFPIGVGIFLVALVGWVYEYYRGYFAR